MAGRGPGSSGTIHRRNREAEISNRQIARFVTESSLLCRIASYLRRRELAFKLFVASQRELHQLRELGFAAKIVEQWVVGEVWVAEEAAINATPQQAQLGRAVVERGVGLRDFVTAFTVAHAALDDLLFDVLQ